MEVKRSVPLRLRGGKQKVFLNAVGSRLPQGNDEAGQGEHVKREYR